MSWESVLSSPIATNHPLIVGTICGIGIMGIVAASLYLIDPVLTTLTRVLSKAIGAIGHRSQV